MLRDCYGNTVTTDNPETVRLLDTYGQEFLSYGTGLPRVFEAADGDPDCAFAQAHAAGVHMALEAAEGFRAADPYLQRAEARAATASPREQAYIKAVRAWREQNYSAVAALLEEIVRAHPEDLVAAKWAQYHLFNMGDQDGLLRLAEAVLPAHGEAPYVYGMLAFGLEQSHRLGEAEDAARKAVEIERRDPWAHHALFHVMETQGRTEEGVRFAADIGETWDDRGIFIRHHNWWHVALFEMDREDYAAALKVFDRHLWGVWPEFAQEQIGAISSLVRLEIRGVDVGTRWQPIVQKVRERELEHVQPFHDLHYVYALARAGEPAEAERFLASMRRNAGRPCARATHAWTHVAIPAAEGLIAHARGAMGEAAARLGAVRDSLHLIGGSHAQRDVFELIFVDALMKSGRFDRALPLVEERAQGKPHVNFTQDWLRQARQGVQAGGVAAAGR